MRLTVCLFFILINLICSCGAVSPVSGSTSSASTQAISGPGPDRVLNNRISIKVWFEGRNSALSLRDRWWRKRNGRRFWHAWKQ